MPKGRKLQTNFSAGELSPRLLGRPDLAKFYNGAQALENVLIYPQGGVERRPGTRYGGEVKDSTKKTRLIPFEFNAVQAYVLEFGNQYIRFWKNGAQIKTSAGGPAYEVASPYLEAELFDIHFRQTADLVYLVHPNHEPRRLSRVSDTNWALNTVDFDPPPTFQADTDISGGATLTPSATSGQNVIFTASAGTPFITGDVGRLIIYGASRAVIVALGPSAGDPGSPNAAVRADILDAFPDTNPIPTGQWLIRNSPQVTLDPNIKEPVGGQVTLTAGGAAFRTADVGKYIKIYGGFVRITVFTSSTLLKGEILSVLSEATSANPSAAPAGSWTMEVEAWSASRGYPSAVEFHEGRLAFGGTTSQPRTFWLSRSNSFEDFSVGPLSDDSLEYVVASRQVNVIRGLASSDALMVFDAANEHAALGPGTNEPLGGDVVPNVRPQSIRGSNTTQPLVLTDGVLFVSKAGRKIFVMRPDPVVVNKFKPVELTALAEHITKPGLSVHYPAYADEPYSQIFFVRSDGVLVVCTYDPDQDTTAFARYTTDGLFESVAAISHPNGDRSQVWVVVNRTINGVTKRYVEYFDDVASEFSGRNWQSLFTDCALVYDGSAVTTITGLGHLEGKTVDVVADGSHKGTTVVTSGQITLNQAASKVEVGLHHTPTIKTMPPAFPEQNIEGMTRSWITLFVRLLNTVGLSVQGSSEKVQSEVSFVVGGQPMDTGPPLFTGDKVVKVLGSDRDGAVTLRQNTPYPFSVLAVFGDLEVGDVV